MGKTVDMFGFFVNVMKYNISAIPAVAPARTANLIPSGVRISFPPVDLNQKVAISAIIVPVKVRMVVATKGVILSPALPTKKL